MLDIDKDGDNDFIVASRVQGSSVYWYRRNVTGWTKYVIDSSFLQIEAGGASLDIDKDGDPDIIFGADSSDNKMWWWENPYPNYEPNIPWKRREIKNSGGVKHHDQLVGDFDGDGEPELVFWNQGARKLYISDIPRDPKNTTPWSYTGIFSWDVGICEGLTKVDIDGDGKQDIVGCGRWFKHKGGTSYTVNIIDDQQKNSRVAAGQLIKGGWPEVVFVPGDGVGRLKWFEWTGNMWLGHELMETDVHHGHSLELADINGDGNLDIFCAEMRQWSKNKDDNPNAKTWIFWGDGKGNFKKNELSSGFGNHESKVADLDGDRDLDILGKPYTWDTPRVDIWLNNGTTHGKGKPTLDNWKRHVIDPEKPWRTVFVASADMDGDGKKDVITGGWWYQNPGRAEGEWKRHTIGSPLNNMAIVYDFDGDGDMDVLGTQGDTHLANADFVWARNNGNGSFTIFKNIERGRGDFLQGVAVASFSNLAPLEVALSWHESGQGVQMLEVPTDPVHGIWKWRRLSRESQDEQLSVGDIDRNGTLDLLLGTRWLCNKCPLSRALWLGWLSRRCPRWARAVDRRMGTKWLGWKTQNIVDAAGKPDRNRLADINGDGRLDAVVGYEAISKIGKLVWYEQPVSIMEEWEEHRITQVVGPMSLDVADMDGDGDLDVVVGEHNPKDPSNATLYIFENMDGMGNSWGRHEVYKGDEHHDGATVTDIEGDGDLDIISIGWGHNKVILYENRSYIKERN